ncbi:hypothetical protein HPB51_024261 [Rhipicephalus microplus]|uniref:Uncharacterized protein n=1 Tax=Rhipicephalus microplus TaxID=6941 RepID=A0A9J6EJB3_RHIMP|nr:hypothetical protein HPB51_024261 [Rhipicephalus microplus]
MDGLARTKRQRFSETHRKGHRGNEPQCETLPEDSFRLILARPPPAAGYYYWLGQRRGPQARMCSLTTSEGRDRASPGQQSGGGLPLWPLSETSCQSAASSPLGISRIPAELAFPSFSGVPEKPVRGGRRSVAAVARRTLPLPPNSVHAFLEKKRQAASLASIERRPAARRGSIGQGSPALPIYAPCSGDHEESRRQDQFEDEGTPRFFRKVLPNSVMHTCTRSKTTKKLPDGRTK